MDLGLIGQVYSIECNMVAYQMPYSGWRTHKAVSGACSMIWGFTNLRRRSR